MNLTNPGDKEFIDKLTGITIKNYADENFGARELILESGINRTTVNQRLQRICNKSVNQFIREIRLQKALEILREGKTTAAETAFQVGFSNPTYFNTSFHEFYGYSPGEARKLGPEKVLPLVHESRIPVTGNDKLKHLFKHKNIVITFAVFFIFVFSGLIYVKIIRNKNLTFPDILRNRDISLAVLPFKNLSDNPDNQYLADGIMEEILNNLFLIKKIRVISRTSVEQFREISKTGPEIARILGVKYILEGSIQKNGNRIKIIVQLIEPKHEKHLFSEKYEREFTDIFDIQNDIALRVADKLKTDLTTDEIKKITKIPTRNPEAYNNYLLGIFYLKKDTKAGQDKSREFFEKALALDPGFSAARTWLADVYMHLVFFGWYPRQEGIDIAKKHISQVIATDPDNALAHKSLGNLYCWYEWNWKEAQKEYEKALALNPDESSIHASYSSLLDIMRKNDAARSEIEIARKINPLSDNNIYLSAYYYYNQRKFKEALAAWKMQKELAPEEIWPYWSSFIVYVILGDGLKAVEELNKFLSMDSKTHNYVNDIRRIYDESGINGLMHFMIELRLKDAKPNPVLLGQLYALLGQKDTALSYLEKAGDERWPWFPRINNCPEIENLRNEPRFIGLMKKIRLHEYSQVNNEN